MKIEVSASILAADFGKLGQEVELCEKNGIDRIHVDVMDGHFVPNISIGQLIVRAVRKHTNLPVKAHLMIEHPWDYIDSFIDAGADIIGIHAECYGERRLACRDYGKYPKEIDTLNEEKARRDIQHIQSRGKEACLVVNPGTPETCLDPVLGDVNSVLVMSVNPGFSGQKFLPAALAKIKSLRAKFHGDIAVDGGIDAESAPKVVGAGANVLVTASYFFGSGNPSEVVRFIHSLPVK